MKLIVNIPVYNEEAHIGKTIKTIRESFNDSFYSQKGSVITEKLIQIVDDGSVDNSVQNAREAGVDIVISYKPNRRLAYSFKRNVESALENGADLMVNIDADLQFNPYDIPKLLEPILDGKSDMVIANRFGGVEAKDIPWIKKNLNKFAARLIGFFLNYKTDDLTCGFRAHSREAMLRFNLTNTHFTYTQETIIDAIGKNLKLAWVPVEVTYYADREAKMTKSIWKFVSNSTKIILKAVRDVRPMKFFGVPGLFLIFLSLISFAIFLYNYFPDFKITPYRNYLIFGVALFLVGLQFVVFALIADMVKSSRQLTEEFMYQWKKDRYKK
ncbi:MAG: glycosyltransferase family 2 protein [Parcubacteria group bacterium]|jgi:glycosyltransferase involved in cell wall biosynthesis